MKNKETKRRIRRSPEILFKELETKMEILENRIYKKNKDVVHIIGTAILKKAKFDFTNLTTADIEDIKNKTDKGNAIINSIMETALKNN